MIIVPMRPTPSRIQARQTSLISGSRRRILPARLCRWGGGDPGLFPIGELPAGQEKTAFFYLRSTAATSTAQSHDIRVYQGRPDIGSQLASSTFTLTVSASGNGNNNKIDGGSVTPAKASVGAIITATVDGKTGPLKLNDPIIFTPSALTTWNAATFQLVEVRIRITNGGSIYPYVNVLALGTPGQNSAISYHVDYTFRAVAEASGTTPYNGEGFFGTGNNSTMEHSSLTTGVTLPAVAPPTNSTTVSLFANVSQLYTNEIITYTIRLTNSSPLNVSLDTIKDTLPNGFSYVAGSSRYNGSSISDPVTSGQNLIWSGTYDIPGSSPRDLVFQATPPYPGLWPQLGAEPGGSL